MKTQADRQAKPVIVLDTSAFLAGFDPFSLAAEQVTVPKVEEEILRNSMVKMRFEAAVESGKLKVKAPTLEAADSAKEYASRVGDAHKLSETDMQLLGLAFELKSLGYTPQIVTDDYSIQNVATQMGIGFLALATFGIKRLLEWIRYCPACHRQYPANCKIEECQVCGTRLKRKPRRTTKNRNNLF
ncbi:MAG TPA: ribonuclease VapC [Candidatus Binatia bacterium]|nr:ribonuclease VapC [Candidatus Binatia bacterium]